MRSMQKDTGKIKSLVDEGRRTKKEKDIRPFLPPRRMSHKAEAFAGGNCLDKE